MSQATIVEYYYKEIIMNIEGFLLDTFRPTEQVTVNANELQALIRDKRHLERELQTKVTQVTLLETALSNSKSKYTEAYNVLQSLESKLDNCNTVYKVNLKV